MSTEKTPEKTQEAFAKAFEELCKEYGMTLSVTPAFVKRDDNTFSLIVNTQIVKLDTA